MNAAAEDQAAWLLSQNRAADALTLLTPVVATPRPSGMALHYQADALQALGRYDEVVRVRQRYVDLYPKEAPGWHNLANAYVFARRPEEGLRCSTHALELDSNRGEIWYSYGGCLDALNRLDEAVEAYGE